MLILRAAVTRTCSILLFHRGNMSLAGQRLQKAFRILRESGDKQERLAHAFTEELLRLRLDDFPSGLRKDFADLIARMCKSGLHNPAVSHGRQKAHMVSDTEIEIMIEMMAALYINVTCHSSSANAQDKDLTCIS